MFHRHGNGTHCPCRLALHNTRLIICREKRTLIPMSEEKAERLQEMYEQRESWCMVERHPTQYWCRAERRHFPQHLRSVLNDRTPPCCDSRSSWTVVTPKHRERRHFAEAGKGHLV
uniref:Uncharacterized protein n=1 Tax=Pyxicephalus adspersus TaxID=30357 RepID=A0AAV3AYG1_PYXAD|nr:TPA: hypothetical protein GDO54_011412 [Pyxicephalus adspersus]